MSVPKLGPHMGRFQANVPVARGEVEGCRDRRRPGEVGNPPGFVKGHVAGPMGMSSRSAVIGWLVLVRKGQGQRGGDGRCEDISAHKKGAPDSA